MLRTSALITHAIVTPRDYYRGAHVVLLVYSVDDKTSLPFLKKQLKEIDRRDYLFSYTKLIVVRNKTDITDRFKVVITKEDEDLFFEQEKDFRERICRRVEVSAENNIGVNALFTKVIPDVLKDVKPTRREKNTITLQAGDRTVGDRQADDLQTCDLPVYLRVNAVDRQHNALVQYNHEEGLAQPEERESSRCCRL